MITLKETIYKEDGETTITEKGFKNKSSVIKLIKKIVPLYGDQIYQLSKFNELTCEFGGVKRKLEILDEIKDAS